MSFGQSVRARAVAAVLAVAVLVAPITHAAVRPPRLDYTTTTLPNGLNVVFLEDHSTPIVHLQVWYHVGSKNERPGRTGFAHFFEHMMFKGSKNVDPEGHPSYISSVGGQSNAYTNEDATVFWETVPAQYLPLVLWLEADRMASLRIDEKAFKNEREVVKEERRMRIENQPYGRLQEIIADQSFAVHPYKHPVIGSMKDLDAASVDDVREFFQTYYVPNNATAVLVGDFDSKEALGLVTQFLGRVPALGQAGAARHPEGTGADQGKAGHPDRRMAAAGGRRRAPHHLRRQPRFVSAAHRVEDSLRRAELADLPQAGLREGTGARGVRRRQHHRGSQPVLRGGDRPAGPHDGRSDQRADRRARQAARGAGHRRRAAAGEEPVRARLHPRPRVEPEQGRAARARRR